MRLRYLFIYLLFSLSVNYKTLLPSDTNENIARPRHQRANSELMALTEYIYNLLLQEHSVNEVMEMLNNQEHPYNNEALTTFIEKLLNKHYSKEEIINIVVNNEEREKYYALRSNREIIKDIVNIMSTLVITALVSYLVSYLLSLSFWPEFSWPIFWQDEKPAGDNCVDDNQESSDAAKPNRLQKKKKQTAHQETQKILHDKYLDQLYLDNKAAQFTKIDPNLDEAIQQQVNHAKSIGLEPIAFEFKALIQRPRHGSHDEQIRYAKSIGLEPKSLPMSLY